MKTTKIVLTLIYLLIFQSIIAQDNTEYCQVHMSRGNNYITNVNFSEINNSSELGTNGYSDFTDKIAFIEQGREYNLEVTTRWSHWEHISIQAWIDWNGDATFDATERVLYKSSTAPISGNILVPADAPLGETRMRIRYNYDAELGPCEYRNNITGEIEDYTVNIVDPRRPDARIRASHTYTNDDKDLIEFADISTNNPTSWRWEFEGGIPSISTDRNPLVRYIRGGVFSVKLIVENEFGKDEIFYDNYITVDLPIITPPVADFSTVLRYVTDANDYVRFDDLSTSNPTAWYWEFEGATPTTSTEQVPQVKYFKSGTYSVKLTVTNQGGSHVKFIDDYITVNLSGACASNNARPSGQYITEVEFSGVRNITTYTDGYELYDFNGASVEKGPYTNTHEAGVMSIKTSTAWEDTEVGYWVDWNQDGDFDDTAEQNILYKPTPTTNDWTFFFTVPDWAKLGKTILRIRAIYGNELSPCGDAWFGETEDYIINVVESDRRGHEGKRGSEIEVSSSLATKNIIVAPNPSVDGVFNFSLDQSVKEASFRVYNVNGIEVYNTSVISSGETTELDLSILEFGLYMVQVQTENKLETVRVVIGE